MATLPKNVRDDLGTGNAIMMDTSVEAFAEFHLDSTHLSVFPSPLTVMVGQTVTWQIEGVPANHSVTFQFDGFGSNGPFSCFTISDGVAVGQNYNPVSLTQGFLAQVQYHVKVLNPISDIIGHHDPLIDTLGDPPTPMEES